MQNLFDFVLLGPLASNVSTLLIAFIGVALLFVGYRYILRSLSLESRSRSRSVRASDTWVNFYTREQGIREGHFSRENYRR